MLGGARPQSVRTLGRAVLVALLALVSAPPEAVGAIESRAAATHDGWWNRLQGPAEGEPEGNPVRPVVPALPKPATVPTDAVATGSTAGQVDKVAAVGIDVTLVEGARLDRLVLRLAESPEPGANLGADRARVVACPATVPWGPGRNAAWQDRPGADCSLGSAEGARGDDGTWIFDLSAIARLWADPFAPLPRHGIVLAVDPAASPSAQVSWLGFDTGNVTVELDATPRTPPPPVDAGGPAPPLNAAAAASPLAGAEPAEPGASDGGERPAGPTLPSAGVPPAAGAGAVTEPAPPAAPSADAGPGLPPDTAAPEHPSPGLGAGEAVGFWENVPGSTALLVLVTAALAVLVGVALGPVGRPAPVLRREGGLSRALARRSATGGSRTAAGTR